MDNLVNNIFLVPLLFFLQILLIFFLSRKTTNYLFHFFNHLFKNTKISYLLITLIFFPGTVIHELSHYFCAIILFLNVKEIQIFPEFKNNQIKLGHVLYYKKDFVRGLIVGLAPFFGALLFFFFISYFHLFPTSNLWQNFLFGYLIFAVSSTMFSSKQDLVDVVYLIPLILIILSVFYVFDIKVNAIIQNQKITQFFLNLFLKINIFLFITTAIHLMVIILLNLFNKFLRRIRF
jgi:hypothetical protein